MATPTLDERITEACEAYRSGQTDSRKALAKAKRLIRIKVESAELARQLAADEDAIPSCP
jgi:hypothetical protein